MNSYAKQNCSCMKIQWMKLKDRNWKQKERHSEKCDNNTPSTNKSSTERVRKHRENKRLLVSITFKLPRSTQESWQHSNIIKEHLPATPNSKTNALINVLNFQSPNTRTNIVNSANVSRKLNLTVYNDLKQKRDKFCMYAQKLVLKQTANQDTKNAHKVFWNGTITSTQSISVKDIIFHS